MPDSITEVLNLALTSTDADELDELLEQYSHSKLLTFYIACNSYVRFSTLERLIDDDYSLIHWAKKFNENFPQYLREYDKACRYVKLNVCANT